MELSSDGSFQLHQTLLDRPAPNRFDDIGRWRLEPGSNRLVLPGSREAPLFFQPLEGGAALRKLDLQDEPIRSRQPDRLQRLAIPQPIEPRLQLQGNVVVERFVGVHTGQGFPQEGASTASAHHPIPARPSLRGTLWSHQALQEGGGPTLVEPPTVRRNYCWLRIKSGRAAAAATTG